VRLGTERAVRRRHPAHAAAEPRNLEAYRLKRGFQQHVLLKTIPAASTVDELFLHRRKIELDRATQQRVEVFERDRIDVSGMNCCERRKIGADCSAKTDARQIFVQPKIIRHDLPPMTAVRQSN
jgi:hypothetical protein